MSTFTDWLKGQAVDAAKDFVTEQFRDDDNKGKGQNNSGNSLGSRVTFPGVYALPTREPKGATRTEMARVVDPMSAMAFWSSAFKAALRTSRTTTRQRLRAKGRTV